MILDNFNTTFIVSINIDIFLINDKIKKDKNTYKSKQKDNNFTARQ